MLLQGINSKEKERFAEKIEIAQKLVYRIMDLLREQDKEVQSAIEEIFEASKPLNLNPFRHWFTLGQQNKEMLEFCKARDLPEDEWTLSIQLA